MPTLDEVNGLSKTDFVQALGWVFEHSPWVAEETWGQRPWKTLEALHRQMVGCVEQAELPAKLALIRAHPDLGSRAKMAEASVGEQKGAGLDALSAAEFTQLHQLNEAYKARFDFPFILAVRGKNKHDILQSMQLRLSNSAEQELHRALSEIYAIAGFRLNDTVKESNEHTQP